MTQKEAIEKALKMLGGRANLQDIYPLAIEIGDFSGSKKPTVPLVVEISHKDISVRY